MVKRNLAKVRLGVRFSLFPLPTVGHLLWIYPAQNFDDGTVAQGPIAQLVRAPPCHGGGRQFKSG